MDNPVNEKKGEQEMQKLTPNDLEVLIHHYVSPDQHPRRSAPAVSSAIRKFLREDILAYVQVVFEDEPEQTPLHSRIMVTEKGRKFLDMVLETPFPVCAWTDPRTINAE
jgi:hypothetical protein